MKKVILFGIGDNGKRIIQAYIKYGADFKIVAVADNKSELRMYEGIPVIRANAISDFTYDEIWISTIYYKVIKRQLIEEMHIKPHTIRYIEFPMPFLEEHIYKKYKDEISGRKKCDNKEFQEVIDYISMNGVRMYCYPFFDEYMSKDVQVYFDSSNGLYYGIYAGHRMYLSKKYNTVEKAENYMRYLYLEQDENSPHNYFSGEFQIEAGDEGIDAGAAEGVFALSVIDKVQHIYLLEADADWVEALELTFRDYSTKVTIVNKYVSDRDDKGQITIDSLAENRKIDFIKMDIEGAEIKALAGANKTIDRYFPRMSVCTYHNAADNQMIGELLIKKGYSIRNSRGYVVCQGEWELDNPTDIDFRKALLWAERK